MLIRPMLDRHFRTVLDAATDGVLIESGECIAYINPAYAAMLGYPSTTELRSATIADIAHPEDFERLVWFGVCRRQGKPAPTRYTFRACGRHASIVTFDASISQTRVDGQMLITTIVRAVRQAGAAPCLSVPGTKELSPREREVVEHLLAGRRSKEIAGRLGMSEKTVNTHRCRAFQKLAVRGLADLFRIAGEQR